MIYFLAGLIVTFYAQLVVNFWLAVRKFGKFDKAIGREHHMFAMDGVSLFSGLMVFYWTAHDWVGFSIPFLQKEPLSSWQCMLMAVTCAVASVGIGYVNGRERFTKATYAGIEEAALRFLATRQIITAAEVAHAMSNGTITETTNHKVLK